MAFDVGQFSESDPPPPEQVARKRNALDARSRNLPPPINPMPEADTARMARQVASNRPEPSLLVPVGAAFTLIAFGVALARVFIARFEGFDWLSPPFALVGSAVGIYAFIRRLRPRTLADFSLFWNVIYWIYFALIVLSSLN